MRKIPIFLSLVSSCDCFLKIEKKANSKTINIRCFNSVSIGCFDYIIRWIKKVNPSGFIWYAQKVWNWAVSSFKKSMFQNEQIKMALISLSSERFQSFFNKFEGIKNMWKKVTTQFQKESLSNWEKIKFTNKRGNEDEIVLWVNISSVR